MAEFHLWHSRNRVTQSLGRVRRPRHFLIYRINEKEQIEIGRVLHDSMDLSSNLPEEYHEFSDEPDDHSQE